MQTLTYCGAKITSTPTAVSQFKGKFNGAMEHYAWVRFAGKLTTCHKTYIAKVSSGAMEGYMHMRGSWVQFGAKLT